ncbi:unnamed protein product [Pedinophyceae sp. YPF-701]|nr:unnamed protein product [Pedinophyceae sp. YPF-701]
MGNVCCCCNNASAVAPGGKSTTIGSTLSKALSLGAGGGRHNKPEEHESAVRVAVVVRPVLPFEKKKGAGDAVSWDERSATVKVKVPADNANKTGVKDFQFNHVYGGQEKEHERLYQHSVRPLLMQFFKGFNCTVLAYGQTGSGKTYTMTTSGDAKNHKGLTFRATDEIFQRVKEREAEYDITVKASFIEVYGDDLRDLLVSQQAAASRAKPAIHTTADPRGGGGSIFLTNVIERECRSTKDVMKIIETGTANRAVGGHNLNEHSSRSHAILQIALEQRRHDDAPGGVRGGPAFLASKLHLVDLAGAERAKETGAEGQRFQEGVNINKGLLALGNVISALTVPGAGRHAARHIPYRDSKLTRILSDSLGGNSDTLMVACVTSASTASDMTVGTLRYASRAMKIKNRVRQNTQMSPVEEIKYLKKIIAARDAEIEALTAQIEAAKQRTHCVKCQDPLSSPLPSSLAGPTGA